MLSKLFNTSYINISNVGNAKVSITVGTTTISYIIRNLRKFVEDALPAGVGLEHIYNAGTSENFVFSDIGDTIPASAGKGFGDTTDPAIGGIFNFLWA